MRAHKPLAPALFQVLSGLSGGSWSSHLSGFGSDSGWHNDLHDKASLNRRRRSFRLRRPGACKPMARAPWMSQACMKLWARSMRHRKRGGSSRWRGLRRLRDPGHGGPFRSGPRARALRAHAGACSGGACDASLRLLSGACRACDALRACTGASAGDTPLRDSSGSPCDASLCARTGPRASCEDHRSQALPDCLQERQVL